MTPAGALPVPVMLNCTSREILVRVGGELREMPRGPVPSIVDGFERGETTEFSVDLERRGRYEVSMSAGRAQMALMLPEPLEGVWFLVEPEVLLRLPHRRDLCTPARYQMEISGEGEERSHESWLVGVHTSLDIASSEISVLTPQQLEGDEDEDAESSNAPA